MRYSFGPRSIKTKLALIYLVAVGPVICVQVSEHAAFDKCYKSALKHRITSSAREMSKGASLPETQWNTASAEDSYYSLAAMRAYDRWLIASIISTLFGVTVVYVSGKRLGQRVRRLALAASAVAVGDYRKRVKMRTGDELETLAKSFNSLGKSMQVRDDALRAQSDLLSKIVDAARLTSSSLDIDECGRAIAKAMCSHLGAKDATVFIRRPSDGTMKVTGSCGKRCRSSWRLVARHASESGEYLLISERPHSAEQADHDPNAYLVGVPMVGCDGVLGAIVARFEGSVPKREMRMGSLRADMILTFGAHAAAAITNAEAHLQTRAAAEKLQESVEALSSIVNVTDAIIPQLTINDTLDALAISAAAQFNADACAIYLPDEQGDLTIRSSSGISAEFASTIRIRPGQGETGKAFSLKRPGICHDMANSNKPLERNISESIGMRGLISAPLMLDGNAIGAITAYFRQPRKFTSRETELLVSVANHVTSIVRNAGLYSRQSSIADVLQSALQSEVPDELCGLKFGSRYLPVIDEARVGGDFYEVTLLPNGKVGILIADVSGKGLQAARHLATCKHMIRALMFTNQDDPAAVLTQLNDALNYYFDLEFFVTAFYGMIDPHNGELVYASAGHLPALLVSRECKMNVCLHATGIPAGAGQSCRYDSRTIRIEQGSTLLLYTDGVTDSQKNGKMLGVEGLHKIVFEIGPCSASELVDHVSDQMSAGPRTTQRDDIALLAITYEGIPERDFGAVGGENERGICISA